MHGLLFSINFEISIIFTTRIHTYIIYSHYFYKRKSVQVVIMIFTIKFYPMHLPFDVNGGTMNHM